MKIGSPTHDKSAVFPEIDDEKYYPLSNPYVELQDISNQSNNEQGVIRLQAYIALSKDFKIVFGYTDNLKNKYDENSYFKSNKNILIYLD